MTIYDKFLRINALKQIDLCNYLHISRAFVSRLVNGQANLSSDNMQLLLNNPYGWDVSPLTSGHSRYAPTPTPKEEIPEPKDDSIPVIPIEAHAGTLSDYSDPAMEFQCERIVSPIAGATCAIRIAGDSMDPEYPNGSIVILKKINEKAFIEWGKVYVLDTCNGSIIKQVRRTDDEDKVECISLNPNYQPFTIATEYINGWYRVLLVMTLK